MLVELVDERANAVVPELDDARVQRGEQPRASRVKGEALDALALGVEERDKLDARRHCSHTTLAPLSKMTNREFVISSVVLAAWKKFAMRLTASAERLTYARSGQTAWSVARGLRAMTERAFGEGTLQWNSTRRITHSRIRLILNLKCTENVGSFRLLREAHRQGCGASLAALPARAALPRP